MMITVEIVGDKEFYDWLELQPSVIKREVRGEVQSTLLSILNDYKAGISKNGNLELGAVADTNDDWQTGETGNTKKESAFIEFGTRAHEITPRVKKFLAFFWPMVGEDVFLKHVNHPGFPANPALLAAWIMHMEPFARFMQRIVNRLDREMK